MFSHGIFIFLLAMHLNGWVLCRTCPAGCTCGNHEVRCILPQGKKISSLNFAILESSSHLYSKLTLSNSRLQNVSLVQALSYLRHVKYIDLSSNNISDLSHIKLSPDRVTGMHMDISYNRIERVDLCDNKIDFLRRVNYLILHHNRLKEFIIKCEPDFGQNLKWNSVDFSKNHLNSFNVLDLISHAPNLKFLNLANNGIQIIGNSTTRRKLNSKLYYLDLSSNDIRRFTFMIPILSLRTLNLSSNSRLHYIDPNGIQNVVLLSLRDCHTIRHFDTEAIMRNLTKLDMTGCTGLRNLDLSLYSNINEVHLSRSNISSFLPPISWNTREAGLLNVRNTHNWNCSCNILWVSSFAQPSSARCASPASMVGLKIPKNLSSCAIPQILNFTNYSVYGLGEKAKLECRVGGRPHPVIIWTTPSNTPHIYRRLTSKRYFTSDETQGSLFHAHHPWHGSHLYKYELEHDTKRYYYVLSDGSLYIDYVTRKDAGYYTCIVLSPLGNHSMSMELRLNYDIIRAVRWHSQIVGMVCAGCMLGIGFTIGIVRLIRRRCRAEERKKRNRTLKVLLENLESYRVDKFDKLRAYKSNKMDQLRDNYNGQVLRIKESCYTHMLNMQDHYNRRIAKIRDNYETKIDRLRDSYSGQMMKIKDYRSHQVERIRDNYNQQILRIREYASVQLMRLREQYRLQQQFFIKLLETLNLENCMAVDVDELDDAIARGAEDLDESDDDDVHLDHQFTGCVIDPKSILAHMGSTDAGDLVNRFPLHSLPSLPGLPDFESFVPTDFQHSNHNRSDDGDTNSNDHPDPEMSPLRSLSPVSEDYLTADSEYESPQYASNSSPDVCSVTNDNIDVLVHDDGSQRPRGKLAEETMC